jgi:rhamnulokinase
MTEAIRGYCRNSGQRVPETLAELARCVYDSLALCYRKVKEEIEQLSAGKLERIRIVGGGCQNRLLNQLCADACQLPVVAGPVEASALGNLSAQMIALGAIENLNAARALIRASFELEEYQPKASVPDQVLERFEHLIACKQMKGEPCA